MTLRSFGVCLAVNVLLAFLLEQVNHTLTSVSLFLYLGGLYIVFPLRALTFPMGLLCIFITGLWIDAKSPVPFGASALLLSFSFTLAYTLRQYASRNLPLLPLAFYLNLLHLLVFLFWLRTEQALAVYCLRGLCDLLLSSVTFVLIGKWFYRLQTELGNFFGCVALRR